MNLRRLAFLSIAMCLPAWGVAADAANDALVRDLGRRWLEANDGVGLSIGVYDNGQRRFYNFGVSQVDGNKAPTKDTIYEIGALSKTMAAQLLARAVVEGRATLNDEMDKYLDEPYPNLATDGEKIRLVHLANMTSQLVDNIPDLSQVRNVPGEPLAATRMKVIEKYTSKQMMFQLHRVAPRRAPGGDPGQSNVASMLLGVVLAKIYDEPFEVTLGARSKSRSRWAVAPSPISNYSPRGTRRTTRYCRPSTPRWRIPPAHCVTAPTICSPTPPGRWWNATPR